MTTPVYQFGDFKLDCGRFELSREEQGLKLERKPLELLILLASRKGLLVTRSEIAQKLWAQEVFVDTDYGINTAVRKIRSILEDDSEKPRYIQTVTGMGYRFIAPISEVAPTEKSAPAAEPPTVASHAETENHHAKSRPTFILAGLVILAVGLIVAISYRRRQPLAVTDYVQISRSFGRKNLVGTDGVRLYFNHWVSGVNQIGQISVTGGETADVPVALSGAVLVDVAPESSSLLVTAAEGSKWGLWMLQFPGGQLRRLLANELVNPTNRFAWSPDGSSSVFFSCENPMHFRSVVSHYVEVVPLRNESDRSKNAIMRDLAAN